MNQISIIIKLINGPLRWWLVYGVRPRPTILLLKAVASLELVYFCAAVVNGREEG